MALSLATKNRLKQALGVEGSAAADELDTEIGTSLTGAVTVSAGGVATLNVTGDIAISGSNVATVNATKLAAATSAFIKTDSGVKDLLAAAAATRQVIIVVTVTTAFADGNGTQPTLTIGEESGSASKFAATTPFVSGAAGLITVFAGTLTSGKKLQCTIVAGTGTTETGAFSITAIAVG